MAKVIANLFATLYATIHCSCSYMLLQHSGLLSKPSCVAESICCLQDLLFVTTHTSMGRVIISQAHSLSIFKISPSQSPPQVFVSWWRFSRLHCSTSRHLVLHVRRRRDIFYSKSWIKNDAQFSHVAGDDEDQEQLPGVTSSCSIPVVNINSDVESESLSLLTADLHIESLFTTFQVLSKEEQYAKVSVPAHPAGLYALYASCFVGNMVEQLWMFVWPVAIALIHPNLLSVVVIGFITKFVIFVGGPAVGKIMDQFPRVPTYNCLSFVQASAQLLSVAMTIHAYTARLTITSSLLFRPWFVVFVLAGAVERLSGLALGVSMERDWIVLLAGENRPIALAEANVVISRIDLLCEIAGSSIFGILLSKFDPVTCLKLAAGFMLWALPVVAVLSWLTNKLSSGVLDRTKCPQTCCRTTSGAHFLDVRARLVVGVDAIKHGWVEYMRQPVFLASIAYVLLYFNIVLTPGGLMSAFLIQCGLDPSIIGGFNGSCAFMGIAATFVSTSLVRRFGILKTGAAGLILQAILLTVAVAVYCTGCLSQPGPLFLFLCLIVLSRLGHMSYDVVGAQILQTGIPSSKANLIGMTEVSVASLAEFVMLGVAIVANETSHFGLLAMLSLLSVLGAACMFCIWLVNLTDEQRSLFSFDSHF